MKTRAAVIGFFLAGAVLNLSGQELITLTVPESVPNNARYRIEHINITLDNPDTALDEGALAIQLVGIERAASASCLYSSATTPTATTLIVGLNKANLSSAYNNNATTGSLKQRIYHRLVVMAEASAVCGRSLAGTLTGTVP